MGTASGDSTYANNKANIDSRSHPENSDSGDVKDQASFENAVEG